MRCTGTGYAGSRANGDRVPSRRQAQGGGNGDVMHPLSSGVRTADTKLSGCFSSSRKAWRFCGRTELLSESETSTDQTTH